MRLNTAQRDRACGTLLATAAGDALGAGYEFGPPLPDDAVVTMSGGGAFGWAPGEWTDDTSMAVAIAEVAARGVDLGSEQAQDEIVARWYEWSRTAADVGNQTRTVLDATGRDPAGLGAATARRISLALHVQTGHTGGNGSLMRTAPVALAFLDDDEALVEAATSISALTHADPEAGEACVLWCLAIAHAVCTGELDLRRGLARLAADRRDVGSARLDEAEGAPPRAFNRNGWVVQALHAAWSAISRTPIPADDPAHGVFRADHLRLALEAAVRGGRDTDTVAAIAGGLLGATYGASAVPASWQRILHGWPGVRTAELIRLGGAIATGGLPDRSDEPHIDYGGDLRALVQHPRDDGVWIGGVDALSHLPAHVDAVVSLCQVGIEDVPADRIAPTDRVAIRLIDSSRAEKNPNLGFVLRDAVDVVRELRAEGRTVYLHCVQAHSRTPTVAALYGARRAGITPGQASDEVCAALPDARPNPAFDSYVRTFDTSSSHR